MKTDTIKVEGMACGHCEIAVQDAIRKISGVKKVKASKGKKQATIEYDEQKTGLEQIIAAVIAIGYDASNE